MSQIRQIKTKKKKKLSSFNITLNTSKKINGTLVVFLSNKHFWCIYILHLHVYFPA